MHANYYFIFEIHFIFVLFVHYFLYNNIRYPLSIMATAIKEKKRKSKADWDDGTTDAFIKICVNETLAEN